MWSFMSSAEPNVFVSNNDEGFERVRNSNGRYAFLAESTTIEFQNQQTPCNTMTVGANLDTKGYGIGTPVGHFIRYRKHALWVVHGECYPMLCFTTTKTIHVVYNLYFVLSQK